MDPSMRGRSCEDPQWQAATAAYEACAAKYPKGGIAPGYTCLPSAPKQKGQRDAQALPCQMDPKFRGASCDDPAMQAAMQAYRECAAQHASEHIAGGYPCSIKAADPFMGTRGCAMAEKCRYPQSLSTAPWAEYDAAGKEYLACTGRVPKGCGVPPFPAHVNDPQIKATKPALPAPPRLRTASQEQQPAPAPGPAPKPAAPKAPPPQTEANFQPVLNQTSQPAFAPLNSKFGGDNSDTQQWLQRQRAKQQQSGDGAQQ
jgi:hypothetical protein